MEKIRIQIRNLRKKTYRNDLLLGKKTIRRITI